MGLILICFCARDTLLSYEWSRVVMSTLGIPLYGRVGWGGLWVSTCCSTAILVGTTCWPSMGCLNYTESLFTLIAAKNQKSTKMSRCLKSGVAASLGLKLCAEPLTKIKFIKGLMHLPLKSTRFSVGAGSEPVGYSNTISLLMPTFFHPLKQEKLWLLKEKESWLLTKWAN